MDDGTVLGRATAILGAVARLGPGVPLHQLVREVGIPKPTTRRIAEDLARRGYLTHADSGGYSLACEVERLGAAAHRQALVSRTAVILAELGARCGGVAWLSTGQHLRLLKPTVVVSESGAASIDTARWPAGNHRRAVLANTALGRLVLADDESLLPEILSAGTSPTTPYSPKSPHDLQNSIARVRDEGVAIETNEFALGWRCAALKVVGADGTAGAIGLSVPSQRSRVSSVLRALQSAAGQAAAVSLG